MLRRYWQPFSEIETLRHQLNQLFETVTETPREVESAWTPAVELADLGDNLELKVQLPGIDPKDIDVQVTKAAISLSDERRLEKSEEQSRFCRSEFRYGKFHRVISLPIPIQNEQVQARYLNGVLTLTLPKVQEVRNKVVKINLGEIAGSSTNPVLESTN